MPTVPPDLPTEEALAARRFLAVTEEELQHIVLDIHDGLVQHLFGAQIQLSLIKRRRQRGESLRDDEVDAFVSTVSAQIAEALLEIRGFLGSFRSPDFVQREVIDIIRSVVAKHETLTGCRVTLVTDGQSMQASLAVKIALYRICQEALSNAYRHAGTHDQTVRIERDGEWLLMEICDEGQGFTAPPLHGPAATEDAEHIGLRGMRERVSLIGGEFDLVTVPGQGTRILVKAPIDE